LVGAGDGRANPGLPEAANPAPAQARAESGHIPSPDDRIPTCPERGPGAVVGARSGTRAVGGCRSMSRWGRTGPRQRPGQRRQRFATVVRKE